MLRFTQWQSVHIRPVLDESGLWRARVYDDYSAGVIETLPRYRTMETAVQAGERLALAAVGADVPHAFVGPTHRTARCYRRRHFGPVT